MENPKDYYKKNAGNSSIREETYQYFLEKYIKGDVSKFALELHEGSKISHNQKPFWIPGRVYTYEYDPKYKDVLDWYDTRPMMMCMGIEHNENTGNDLVWGINLSFLPEQVRTTVLQFYWDAFRKEIEHAEKSFWEGKLFLTVQKVVDFIKNWVLQLKIFSNQNTNLSFAYRKYIIAGPDAGRIRNATLVEYTDWSKSVFFASKEIQKVGLAEIYNLYWKNLPKNIKRDKKNSTNKKLKK